MSLSARTCLRLLPQRHGTANCKTFGDTKKVDHRAAIGLIRGDACIAAQISLRHGLRMRSDEISVIAPNLKTRWSGVTSTVFRLIPAQTGRVGIACTGPRLPKDLPRLSFLQILTMRASTARVWHARRNKEMLAGLLLKYVLRKNLKLLFTSAAQREHSGYTCLLYTSDAADE